MNARMNSNRIANVGPVTSIGRIFAVAILVALFLAVPKPAHAGRLAADTIALFPKEIGEFAYADLKKARTLSWFPQLQEQLLPDRFKQFERFPASAGIDPNSQVEELAWGLVPDGVTAKTAAVGSDAVPTGEEIFGVALGNLNPSSAKLILSSKSCRPLKPGATRYTLSSAAPAPPI